MTSIDSSTGAYVSVDGLVVTSRRRGAVVDAEPAGQPQLVDGDDAQRHRGCAGPGGHRPARQGRAAGRCGSRVQLRCGDQRRGSGQEGRRAVRAGRREPRGALDRGAAPPGGRGRAGSRCGRRRIAGVGVRRRTRFGQGLFHARLHQDRPDARRRRFGSGRGGGRPDPRDADGAAGREDSRRRGIAGRAW